MTWYSLEPKAATRDLWVAIDGPTKPEYGVWWSSSGQDITEVLGADGPPAITDVEWYFRPMREHYGKRLPDALWQYGRGLKVYSERLCEVMQTHGAGLQTWPADVRHRDGTPVPGYLAVLEEVEAVAPVHSHLRHRRSGRVVVDATVKEAVVRAGLIGLEIEEVAGPFPAGDFRHHARRRAAPGS
ncbi:MAG TPA: hypothetical protein VLA70_11155 [Nocardioides sp.]|nr:hypothetical protein [Nocardioides sp.]